MSQDNDCPSLEDVKRQVERMDDRYNDRFEIIEGKYNTILERVTETKTLVITKIDGMNNRLDGINDELKEQREKNEEVLKIAYVTKKVEKKDETISDLMMSVFKDAVKSFVIALFFGIIVLVAAQTNVFK